MEKHYQGIINFTDQLLDNGKCSYRQIAQKLREEYACCISHESVRQYNFFRTGKYTQAKEPIKLYYCIKKIRTVR